MNIKLYYQRILLFIKIVFRLWETVRLWPRLAWEIVVIIWPKVEFKQIKE